MCTKHVLGFGCELTKIVSTVDPRYGININKMLDNTHCHNLPIFFMRPKIRIKLNWINHTIYYGMGGKNYT